jgi:hypothetical protein
VLILKKALCPLLGKHSEPRILEAAQAQHRWKPPHPSPRLKFKKQSLNQMFLDLLMEPGAHKQNNRVWNGQPHGFLSVFGFERKVRQFFYTSLPLSLNSNCLAYRQPSPPGKSPWQKEDFGDLCFSWQVTGCTCTELQPAGCTAQLVFLSLNLLHLERREGWKERGRSNSTPVHLLSQESSKELIGNKKDLSRICCSSRWSKWFLLTGMDQLACIQLGWTCIQKTQRRQ